MDNSRREFGGSFTFVDMHSKHSSRWLKLITATLAVTGLVGFFLSAPSQAITPNPTPVCSDGTCYLTFDYSGDSYYWVPPTGINSLHFDVYGAQGGRAGGKGGSVSGDFQNLTAGLFVYPGGPGGAGNTVAGGFNGGGISGSGHADAGSGGGASDIRLSTSTADRIVVAGGGGGTGGWIGGVGGAGGLTIASAGTRGSSAGTAGGGGSQISGGTAGIGVTTGNGTAGQVSTGGTGGSGSVAGGGGGGGGFFGGGGGGSDSVAGGSDGAGGGGGSSFATLALTSNIVHMAGVRSGSGVVVLRYTYAPNLNYFQSISRNDFTNSNQYRISFDQYIYDLTPEDFVLSGTASPGCFIANLYGDGYVFEFEISGCANGTLNVSLRSNSVTGSTLGPIALATAPPILIDTVNPGFRITSPASPNSADIQKFVIIADEPFVNTNPSVFSIQGAGCQAVNWPMTSASTMELWLAGCQSGSSVSIQIMARSIRDLQGNAGPNVPVGSAVVVIDRDAPTLASIVADAPMADFIPYQLDFNESVTGLSLASFRVSGAGCLLSKLDGGGSKYQLWLTGCTETPTLTLRARTATDQAGNTGPLVDSVNGSGSIDQTPPVVQFQETSRTDRGISPSFQVSFTEPVTGFTLNSLSRTGSAKGCTFNLTEIQLGQLFQLQSSNCSQGTLRLSLPALSVADMKGNAGPMISTESALVFIETMPAASTVAPARVVPLSIPAPVGEALMPGSTPVVKPVVTKTENSGIGLVEQVRESLERVPPLGWLGAGALILGAATLRRLIRR